MSLSKHLIHDVLETTALGKNPYFAKYLKTEKIIKNYCLTFGSLDCTGENTILMENQRYYFKPSDWLELQAILQDLENQTFRFYT